MSRVWNAVRPVVEVMEGRTLLSGGPLSINQVPVMGGTQLQVQGTPGDDQITITQMAAGLTVSNGDWSQVVSGTFSSIRVDGGVGNDSIAIDPSVHTDCILFGGAGNNTLSAGSGNDRLYAGTGKNLLKAGSGNDILVSLGSVADTLVGGAGHDSFWVDAGPREKVLNLRADEIAGGNVHHVGAFFGTTAHSRSGIVRAMASTQLAEPAVTDGSTTYQDYSNHPLFSAAGPSQDDIAQGEIGDCYFLSTLSAIAKVDPGRIRQSVLDMGDGTYLVQFCRGRNVTVYRPA